MFVFDLKPALRARYILIGVSEYDENPCIRFDMLGCLAPAASQQVPLELQVGWNSSVPQCIDTEPPAFTNCPPEVVRVRTDAQGQLVPVTYDVPRAIDNSGLIAWTRVQPENFAPPAFITQVRVCALE
jgi:hypothetical protein